MNFNNLEGMEVDYAKNIKLYIEQERLKLISYAGINGIKEEDMEKLLMEQNINDFSLENLKIRMGIIEKRPDRMRKTAATPKNGQ